MLEIYLIRHGETKSNVERRIQGQSDSLLTINGIKQSQLTAKKIKMIGINYILSSDLGRTKKTAKIIKKNCSCKIIFEKYLRELNMGILEGRMINSLNNIEKSWRNNLINGIPNYRIPQGESIEEITKRMFFILEKCYSFPKGSKLLLITHGIALNALFNYLLGRKYKKINGFQLENCSISKLDCIKKYYSKHFWSIKFIGDISHLSFF
ncbi:MAG: histidine phosphatase family protein [Arsenophonus sp.]|nr:MAG: histidine phosphatase family protein [Arsenophonus sp.]